MNFFLKIWYFKNLIFELDILLCVFSRITNSTPGRLFFSPTIFFQSTLHEPAARTRFTGAVNELEKTQSLGNLHAYFIARSRDGGRVKVYSRRPGVLDLSSHPPSWCRFRGNWYPGRSGCFLYYSHPGKQHMFRIPADQCRESCSQGSDPSHCRCQILHVLACAYARGRTHRNYS